MTTIEQAKKTIIERLSGLSGSYSVIAAAIGVDSSTIAKTVRKGMDSNPSSDLLIKLERYFEKIDAGLPFVKRKPRKNANPQFENSSRAA